MSEALNTRSSSSMFPTSTWALPLMRAMVSGALTRMARATVGVSWTAVKLLTSPIQALSMPGRVAMVTSLSAGVRPQVMSESRPSA